MIQSTVVANYGKMESKMYVNESCREDDESENNNLDFYPENSTRKEILYLGFVINPNNGSESGAGWALLKSHLDGGARVHIICNSNSEESILEELKKYPGQWEFIHLKNFDLYEKIVKEFPFSLQLRSLIWNFCVLREWDSIMRLSDFKLVHYATFAGDWNFCAPLFKKEIPMLWGPIGGAQRIPISLLHFLGFAGSISEIFRGMITSPLRHFNKYLAIKRSNILIICLNDAVQSFFSFSKLEFPISSNVSLPCLTSGRLWRDSSSNYYFAAGRLIALKNWGLAIKSLALMGDDSRLIIAGSGTSRKQLEKLAVSLNVAERVIFLGQTTQAECIDLMLGSKGVVFPSLRDSNSWSLTEAAHYGVPIVALDLPGPRAVSNFAKFELVPIKTRSNLVEIYSEYMKNPPKVSNVGQFCKCRMRSRLFFQLTQM
jgi:glycosyltransferase involved in cell wall biosynthesis